MQVYQLCWREKEGRKEGRKDQRDGEDMGSRIEVEKKKDEEEFQYSSNWEHNSRDHLVHVSRP